MAYLLLLYTHWFSSFSGAKKERPIRVTYKAYRQRELNPNIPNDVFWSMRSDGIMSHRITVGGWNILDSCVLSTDLKHVASTLAFGRSMSCSRETFCCSDVGTAISVLTAGKRRTLPSSPSAPKSKLTWTALSSPCSDI